MSISQIVPLREAELALLEELKNDGRALKTGELVSRAIKRFPDRLTKLELQRKTPSGTPWWQGRFRFDLNRLKKNGEARRAAKGYWEITSPGIQRLNGSIQLPVRQSNGLTETEIKLLDWAEEVLEAIKAGEVATIIQTKQDGFIVDLGKHTKETQIVVGGI